MLKNLTTLLLVIGVSSASALFIYKNIKRNEVVALTVNQDSEKVALPKSEIETIIKEFITKNPKLILDSLQNLEQEKKAKRAENFARYLENNLKKLETANNPPIFGEQNADISVVMFYDYSCNYCKKAGLVVNNILKSDPNVKFIARPVTILNKNSVLAAKIFLAVHKITPEKLLSVHNELLTSNLSTNLVKKIAEKYQIDYTTLKSEINTRQVDQLLRKNQILAKHIGSVVVPTFIINGTLYKGFLSEEDLRKKFFEIRATLKK